MHETPDALLFHCRRFDLHPVFGLCSRGFSRNHSLYEHPLHYPEDGYARSHCHE